MNSCELTNISARQGKIGFGRLVLTPSDTGDKEWQGNVSRCKKC